MKERILIIGAIGLVVLLLILLNAASYVQKEKTPDSEAFPNRSTYAIGPTGSRAFHDLLVSFGYDVTRWRKPASKLAKEGQQISTFVIVGPTRRKITDLDAKEILNWVSYGGNLVVFDRDPHSDFLQSTGPWKISVKHTSTQTKDELQVLKETVDPSNSTQMTTKTEAVIPNTPSIITDQVNAVQPSKFATDIDIRYSEKAELLKQVPEDANQSEEPEVPVTIEVPISETADENATDIDDTGDLVTEDEEVSTSSDESSDEEVVSEESNAGTPDVISTTSEVSQPPPPPLKKEVIAEPSRDVSLLAPVEHLSGGGRDLVTQYPFGYGRITIITDPYIISNGGLRLVDNAVLGTNIVKGGTIAFDEYHQGFGADESRLLAYLSGTPTVAIFLQIFFIVVLILYGRSRRFGRPLPVEAKSRLSNLEYVGAMAQLKRRTRAYDLAIENIYGEFRRRAGNLLGMDPRNATKKEFADAISQRTEIPAAKIETTFTECEDVMHGAKANNREVLRMTKEIRALEKALGLTRRNVSTAAK